MKTLTLLRHAKSGWDDPVARDYDRPLNTKGERAAATMGLHLRSLGLRFDHVVASPALRVVETIEHFASAYGSAIEPHWERRVYLASAATLLDTLRDVPAGADRVLLVGHNPGLEDLVLLLVPDGEDGELRVEAEKKFPTASMATIEFDGEWADLAFGDGRLIRFVRPRDLDPNLGPDQD